MQPIQFYDLNHIMHIFAGLQLVKNFQVFARNKFPSWPLHHILLLLFLQQLAAGNFWKPTFKEYLTEHAAA